MTTDNFIHQDSLHLEHLSSIFLYYYYSSEQGFVVETTAVSGDKEQIHFYDSSRALLIGAGIYNAGWPNLESVEKEILENEFPKN